MRNFVAYIYRIPWTTLNAGHLSPFFLLFLLTPVLVFLYLNAIENVSGRPLASLYKEIAN
jgi:hypothetical protein